MVRLVLLSSNKDKSGKCPVVIQVNHDYKTKRQMLFKIQPKYWTGVGVKRSHPDNVKLNNQIRTELNKYEKRMDELKSQGTFTVDRVFESSTDSIRLIESIRKYQERLEKKNKIRSSLVMKRTGDKVEQFDPGVLLASVNVEWLENYRVWISGLDGINSEMTINKHVKTIKTVLRYEFSNDRYHDQKTINFKLPTARSTNERLTREEFARWSMADVPAELELYRDFFMGMVYLRGLRVGDTLQLKPEDVVDGRIRLMEDKTVKVQDIKIIPKLQAILDRYAGQSNYYLFPLLTQRPQDPKLNRRYEKHIESKTAVLNKNYKLVAAYAGIKKKVTNHTARRTFADFAARSGVDVPTISKMLNHSSIRVTEIYFDESLRPDELDNAADKIFG